MFEGRTANRGERFAVNSDLKLSNVVTTTELKTKQKIKGTRLTKHLLSEVQKKDNQFSKPIELYCRKVDPQNFWCAFLF